MRRLSVGSVGSVRMSAKKAERGCAAHQAKRGCQEGRPNLPMTDVYVQSTANTYHILPRLNVRKGYSLRPTRQKFDEFKAVKKWARINPAKEIRDFGFCRESIKQQPTC